MKKTIKRMNIHTLAFPSSSGERSLLPGKPLTAFTVRNLDNGQKSTNTEEATRDCYTRWRTEWRGGVRRGKEARWIAHRTEWGRGEALRREETGWGTGMTVGFGCWRRPITESLGHAGPQLILGMCVWFSFYSTQHPFGRNDFSIAQMRK